jgi:hypothetical protein
MYKKAAKFASEGWGKTLGGERRGSRREESSASAAVASHIAEEAVGYGRRDQKTFLLQLHRHLIELVKSGYRNNARQATELNSMGVLTATKGAWDEQTIRAAWDAILQLKNIEKQKNISNKSRAKTIDDAPHALRPGISNASATGKIWIDLPKINDHQLKDNAYSLSTIAKNPMLRDAQSHIRFEMRPQDVVARNLQDWLVRETPCADVHLMLEIQPAGGRVTMTIGPSVCNALASCRIQRFTLYMARTDTPASGRYQASLLQMNSKETRIGDESLLELRIRTDGGGYFREMSHKIAVNFLANGGRWINYTWLHIDDT